MAGDWIAMRMDLRDDPQVIQLASSLGIDEYGIIGRLHHFWSWVNSQMSSDHVMGVSLKWIDRLTATSGFGKALVEVGWLEEIENGIRIPKFDRYNSESAKRRILKAERQRQYRSTNADTGTSEPNGERSKSKRSTSSSTGASTRPSTGASTRPSTGASTGASSRPSTGASTTEQNKTEEKREHEKTSTTTNNVCEQLYRHLGFVGGGAAGLTHSGIHPAEVVITFDGLRADKSISNPNGLVIERMRSGWAFTPPTMDDLFKFLKRRSPGTAITKEPDGIHVDGWGLFAPLKGFNTSQHWMRLVFRDDGTIDWSQVEQATMQGLADDVPASPAPP